MGPRYPIPSDDSRPEGLCEEVIGQPADTWKMGIEFRLNCVCERVGYRLAVGVQALRKPSAFVSCLKS